MTFIFVDPPVVGSVGTNTTALGADTATAGAQASMSKAVPPGLDPQSAANAAAINTYTTHATTQLNAAGVLQNNRGEAILVSATAYPERDSMNATGLTV
ncbi:MAG: PE domain-containing protein [Mycobacterium sp.]|nr:PE domain-containing protein [Mycobacterium sp.]